jgi:hypothetical protein
VSAFLCAVLSGVGRGLATGRSRVQISKNKFISLRSQILYRNRPEGIIRTLYLFIYLSFMGEMRNAYKILVG